MILDICLAVFLLIFVVWGKCRGLAKMIFSSMSLVISIFVGYLLQKPVSAFLGRLDLSQAIAKRLGESVAIENLPGVMRDLPLVSAAADELYQSVAQAAVGVLSFVAVVVITKLVLSLVSAIVGLASSLPVIHQANGLAGGILGFALGAVFALLIFAGLGALEAFGKLNVMGQLLTGSRFAALVYNNNPLLSMILNLT